MKLAYKILVDGDADIPQELENKVAYVPQYVIYEGKSYKATRRLIEEGMKDMLVPGKISTSMPSVGDFAEAMDNMEYPALAIHVSSGISSAYKSIENAAKEKGVLDKLYIFDTKTAATGIGAYVYVAYRLAENGISPDEIYDMLIAIRDTGKEKTYGLVGDARFAIQGGRVKGLAAAAAKAMRFMVIVSPNKEGYIEVIHKTLGRKKAIKYILTEVSSLLSRAQNPIVGISHAWSEKDALYIKDELKKVRNDAYFFVTYINPTLIAHGGVGTLSVSVLDSPIKI